MFAIRSCGPYAFQPDVCSLPIAPRASERKFIALSIQCHVVLDRRERLIEVVQQSLPFKIGRRAAESFSVIGETAPANEE